MKMCSGLTPVISRLRARRLELLALAEIGGEGHDLAIIGLLQPFQDHAGVEPARIGEDDAVDLIGHGSIRSANAALRGAGRPRSGSVSARGVRRPLNGACRRHVRGMQIMTRLRR